MEEQSGSMNMSGKGEQQQINGSVAAGGSIPSSPFELRRHRSFYDTTGNANANNMPSKRRASAKAKSSNQILNFFRSQSHEPKSALNNNHDHDDILNNHEGTTVQHTAAAVSSAGTEGAGQVGTSICKPRKQRPQSLYTKTTSSKGVFQYRTSTIETTPETPETSPIEFVGGAKASGGDVEGDTPMSSPVEGSVMSTSASSHSSGGGASGLNDEQLPILNEEQSNNRSSQSGGENSSSGSSVSSSDSYASCGGTISTIRADLEVDLDNLDDNSTVGGIKKDNDRQSLKHLSVSAPAMRTGSTKSSGGDGSDSGLPPMTTSKSRQKKFHRHFKNVPPDEKVLDYYSCALVGDILLQGFLYITENYFAFYSNVFGYVTKVLIPVCTVVRITKERTAKIFPNAVGVCSRTEKHVFASLISRDTTFKLMCKVWNYSIEQEAEEIRQLQRRVAAQVEAEDGFSADVPVPDESSGDSGSGNDSAIEPSSHSPSPQNTPGIEKLVHAKSAIPSHLVVAANMAAVEGAHTAGMADDKSVVASLISGAKLTADETSVPSILSYRGTTHQFRTNASASSNAHLLHGTASRQSQQQNQQPRQESSQFRRLVKSLGLSVGGRGPSLLLVATALLVILFISAALLLNRISSLQQRLLERPVIQDSEQFYQELLSWQTKLHSTTGDEIHQYINSNLQQIVKVRESLEALSMLFVNRPHQEASSLGEAHPSGIMGGADHHHHHKDS